MDAMRLEERAGAEIIELATIITLNALDGDPKLCANISKEVRKGGEGVRF
jgi:hypothetical protein